MPVMMFMTGCLLFLTGCNKDEEPAPTDNIWQLVQKTEGLDSLEKYLSIYADLITTLEGAGTKTLFAPNNDAFINLMATPGFPPDISLINPDLIKNVLLYHIADQRFGKGDLTSGVNITTLETEDIIVNDDGTLKTGATNPKIEIDQADIKATNGIMHTTKSVLIPPTVGATLTPLLGTVAGTIMLGANFSTLAEAVQKADTDVPTGQESLLNILKSTTADITIFAPPNDVFEIGEISVSDYTAQTWRYIILYHIIPGTVTSANLTARTYTSLMTEKLYITNTVPGDYVNGYPIVVPDAVSAANGTVHVLAGFLVPGLLLGGNIVQVVEFQGFDSLAVALELSGLAPGLGSSQASFTLLAPPNEAFVGLLAAMSLQSLNQIPAQDLQGLLAYHIIGGYYFSSDFTDGADYDTQATGLTVQANLSQTEFSFTDNTDTTVPVVVNDLKATNGVIHVIGGILQPQ